MTQQAITPLSMSQTKEELLRHLGMSTHTYDLMADETARTYTRVVSHPGNFKQQLNTPVPPFDWSDITELAKQHAAFELSRSTNPETAPYWQMGETPQHGNNWVAIWFLYHKFRYRDGRNRAKDYSKKGTKKHQRSGSDGKKSSIRSSSSRGSASLSSQSSPSARSSEVLTQLTYYQPALSYASPLYSQPVLQQSNYPAVATREYFDPVRNEYTTPH